MRKMGSSFRCATEKWKPKAVSNHLQQDGISRKNVGKHVSRDKIYGGFLCHHVNCVQEIQNDVFLTSGKASATVRAADPVPPPTSPFDPIPRNTWLATFHGQDFHQQYAIGRHGPTWRICWILGFCSPLPGEFGNVLKEYSSPALILFVHTKRHMRSNLPHHPRVKSWSLSYHFYVKFF